MDGSIALSRGQRKRLLEVYRRGADPQARLRAHVILPLSAGYTWAVVSAVQFCSTATIAPWKARFESGGVDALLEERWGRASALVAWAAVVISMALNLRDPVAE